MGFKEKIIVEPRGLGDSLANLTFIAGIDVTVKKIADKLGVKDCGCDKRQERLNELFPYKG